MPRQQRVNHDFSIGELKDRRNGSRARLSCSVVARMYFLPKARKHANPAAPRYSRAEWLPRPERRQNRGGRECNTPSCGRAGLAAGPSVTPSGGMSHIRIIRSAPAFRRNPSYVLVRIFDVTGFAMNAVLRVNDEAGLAGLLNPFINSRRAVTCRRSGIDVVLG